MLDPAEHLLHRLAFLLTAPEPGLPLLQAAEKHSCDVEGKGGLAKRNIKPQRV
jgi:hypothetical protein